MRYLHTMLRVRNLDTALKFYQDALGLKEVRRVDNDKAKFTLVFLCATEDEGLLKASKGTVTWKAIRKAITAPQGWPAVGGKPEWGFVKLGHTDPTKSNSGIATLYLMTLEWYGKPTVEVGDLLKLDYQAFVKDIERGVTKFESSTGTFMTDIDLGIYTANIDPGNCIYARSAAHDNGERSLRRTGWKRRRRHCGRASRNGRLRVED